MKLLVLCSVIIKRCIPIIKKSWYAVCTFFYKKKFIGNNENASEPTKEAIIRGWFNIVVYTKETSWCTIIVYGHYCGHLRLSQLLSFSDSRADKRPYSARIVEIIKFDMAIRAGNLKKINNDSKLLYIAIE